MSADPTRVAMRRCFLAMAVGMLFGLTAGMGLWNPAGTPAAQVDSEAERETSFDKRRAELYDQLRRQTDVLRKHSAVVKIVIELIGPTVVHIEADVTKRADTRSSQGGQIEEAGAGVIILRNKRHYVLTNLHVIRGAPPERINIKLADRRRIQPTEILKDPETDIAVLAVEAPDLPAARLGNSNDLQVGDFVLAVGSPFGLSHSVSFGIVSAKGRRNLQLGNSEIKYQEFIQTDASINPGNSGGPLINLQGEVVGLNTAIASNSGRNEGIGFAIPINMAASIARQLIDKGEVSRAFLGVSLDSAFGPAEAAKVGLPRPTGTLITRITPDSPAEAADLRCNDVILELENVPVEDDAHLVNLISFTEVGKTVSIVVFRAGKRITVTTKLTDRSKFQ